MAGPPLSVRVPFKPLFPINSGALRRVGCFRLQAFTPYPLPGSAGWEFVHVAIDDHRLLRVALGGPIAVGFLERAVQFYADYDVKVQRVMTDG
jgi:hypothetical protein